MKKVFKTSSYTQTVELGTAIGKNLIGGEIFELKSDLGGGKTTFVSGLAKGLGSLHPVASPSFVISSVYSAPNNKELHHFDFYRLDDPGVVKDELSEVIGDKDIVVAVEWAAVVEDALPPSTITVEIKKTAQDGREIAFSFDDSRSYLFENGVDNDIST